MGDENGDFRLSLKDIIPLKDIEPLLSKKNKKSKKMDLSIVEELKETEHQQISLLQISRGGQSKLYSIDINDGKIVFTNGMNKLELMNDEELENLLKYPVRRKVDLSGYKQLEGVEKGAPNIQSIIDDQLKKIRLLRLQAANRLRAVNLKNQREQKRNKQSDMYSMLSS